MKKSFLFLLSFSIITVILNSCTPDAPTETPTKMIATPSILNLTAKDSTASASIGLTCGCAFTLIDTAYGGNTNVIHFSYQEPLNTLVTVHTLHATIIPSKLPTPGKDSAWVILTHFESGPGQLWDTIRVYANY